MVIQKDLINANQNLKVEKVSETMLKDLKDKLNILNQTGKFNIDPDAYANISDFRNFLSYIKNLKTYEGLNEMVKAKGHSIAHHTYLNSFKVGLTFVLDIPDNKNLLNTKDLVTIGRYITKEKNIQSIKVENIIKNWAKYSIEIDQALSLLEKKHSGFMDILKRNDELTTKVLKYLLTEQEDIGEIVSSLSRNESNYLFNRNGLFKITQEPSEGDIKQLNNDELPVYVIATFFEIVYRDNIENIIREEYRKRAGEGMGEESFETIAPIELDSDSVHEVVNELDDDDEYQFEEARQINSLDDTIDIEKEYEIANVRKPSVMITQFGDEDDIDEKVKEYITSWDKMGISSDESKIKLSVTLISVAKGLLKNIDNIPDELKNMFNEEL